MTLDGYFKLSSYVLIVASFGMLVATGQLDWFSIGAFSVSVILAAFTDAGRVSLRHPTLSVLSQRLQLWKGTQWLLRFALLPLYAIDTYWIASPPRLVVVHLLLAWMALHLLRIKYNKDWLRLYIATFFAVLMAASMTLDAWFFVLLVVYLLAAISTLVSFEIRRAQDAWQLQHQASALTTQFWRPAGAQRATLRAPHWRNVFVFACLSLFLIAVLATPLFLAMPRMPRPFGGDGAQGEAMSGFTESVRLGEIARIKLNRQRVMRVKVKWPAPEAKSQLYWRGVALDYYDGGTWMRTVDAPQPLREELGGGFLIDDKPARPPYTEQFFFLEPINTNVVFVAPRAIWINGPDRLKRDDSQSLFTDHHSFSRYRYQVASDTTVPKANDLRADQAISYSAPMRQHYLQLPPQLDTRIPQLAKELAGDAKTNYDIAARIVERLQNDFRYSLDLHVVEQGDPLSDFLFNTRAGHCEYFASALTILLRTRGIPARLVNGFQMGEYNQRSDLYVVRQSDAHSWVEAYFPRHGWVIFDATPSDGLSQYDDTYSGLFGWLQQLGESAQSFWQERVIEFDSYEQFSLLMNMQRRLSRMRNEAEHQWFNWQAWLAEHLNQPASAEAPEKPETEATASASPWAGKLRWALTSACGIAVLAGAWWWWRRTHSWRYRFARDAAGSAVAFYEQMLALLAQHGFRRQPTQTPREFASQVKLPGVQELTQLYQQARFGSTPLSVSQIDRISALLRDLQLTQRRKKW